MFRKSMTRNWGNQKNRQPSDFGRRFLTVEVIYYDGILFLIYLFLKKQELIKIT